MRDGRMVAVVGKRGTGKTVSAKSVAAQLRRDRSGLIVFDPARGVGQDEWWPAGWNGPAGALARDRRAYLQALADGRTDPLLVKARFREWAPLQQLPDVVIVVDEAHLYADASRIDPAFEELATVGRHLGQDLIIVTQRIASLHQAVVQGVDLWIVHPLQGRNLDAVRSLPGFPSQPSWEPIGDHPTARRPITLRV